ncbi:Coenzyme F420 hydrogenase/dehydrogenase, beta subunit C-terminal domain [Jannaschia donghaensis]|uniref:Coenzyme F420-reducing hydrogenase subunit beta n=1 Tax=Jannaschia donghaensis TaxID=420998 RepID=A0A0M6YG61_9RHOB|nr:Coenzyme F420 hydrogenase/dehydrogenase, beta subunit C-terminal domain [Jannaschia donghaensis]CTQ49338.1 coenzyme F420-reducing hydrogenase subunit beta [Jannaschia donghaensis]
MFPDAIAMRMQDEGFLRPQQVAPLPVGGDDAIAAVCPGLGVTVTPSGGTDDTMWGPYRKAWSGWSTDADQRHRGASGGALTALLTHLLRAGVVQAVVQNAPARDDPTANRTVLTDDPACFATTAGSRYAPSAPLDALPDILADGRRVAFVGKPCDAAALAAIRARDPAVARAIPVIVSFFCAGVPSARGAQGILEAMDVAERDVTAFRYRGKGWPGRATATLADGTERSMSYADSWGDILSKHVQHRCKICADGTGMAADLVCADAWQVDARGYPLFEEEEGVSLILARTVLGEQIAQGAKAAGRLHLGPFDMDTLGAIQPGQRNRRRALRARLAALCLLGRPVPRYHGLHIRAVSRQNGLRVNLRNFVGTLRRALRS